MPAAPYSFVEMTVTAAAGTPETAHSFPTPGAGIGTAVPWYVAARKALPLALAARHDYQAARSVDGVVPKP
jgi:hypothetical protein